MKTESSSTKPKTPRYREVIIITVSILILIFIAYVVYVRFIRQESVVQPVFAETIFAVIPSSSIMCDPELEYMSDGLHDAVVNELGRISNVLVKSKSAAEKYKDSDLSAQQIGDEIGANVILKPRFECTGEGFQMHFDLIKIPEGELIMSTTEPFDLADIYTNSRHVIRQLTKELGITLSPEDEEYLNTARPVNPEMYRLYSLGIFWMNRLTTEGFERGQEYFRDAIAVDPTDPLPYVGLALSYSNFAHLTNVSADAPRLAKEYATKALELDPTQADALNVLATGYFYDDWDFTKAEQALKSSIKLNPSIASAHYNLGWYYALSRQWDKAAEEIGMAVEIAPTDPIYMGNLAALYFWMGDFEEAIVHAQNTIAMYPGFGMGYHTLGRAYAKLGRFNEAIETLEKAIVINPNIKFSLGVAYALAGRREEALEIAAELEKLDQPSWYSMGLAEIYATLENKDKAIQWVETAYEVHQNFVPWYHINPNLESIHDDPRFIEIIDRLNLPS